MNKSTIGEDSLSLNIHSTRVGDLLRIEADRWRFLVSPRGVAILEEVIDHRVFGRVKMENGTAMHLNYNRFFNFQGRLLEVQAESRTSYGPLGDRMLLTASYDGKELGHFSGLRSYMGGGCRGVWPWLSLPDGVLFFSFSISGMGAKTNELQIEWYRNIVRDRCNSFEPYQRKSISSNVLPEGFTEEAMDADMLSNIREEVWKVPVSVDEGKEIAMLGCYRYPGVTRYEKSYYGNWENISKIKEDRVFFGSSLNGEDLYGLEFEKDGRKELYFPWEATWVRYQV